LALNFTNFTTQLVTYDMNVYFRKDRQHTAQYFTATNATGTELTRKLGQGHKVYRESFFSSPDLSDDLTKQ
jgi:hypothetical protein